MILAVLVALVAATCFAAGAVMEHRAASSVPVDRGAAGLPRLLWRLVRTPRWVAAVAVGVGGFALQGLALRLGSVVVVQPVLASGLVISLVLGFLVDRRHPGRPLPDGRQWVAALVVVAGLGLFLVVAAPSPGRVDGSRGPLALCVGASLALSAAAVLHARRPRARHGALVLGVAAGSAFGVMALALNALVAHPPLEWLTTWHTPAVLVLGAGGMALSQLAYQAGALSASLPAITVMEPLVALGAAGPVFGESLAPGIAAHAAQGAGVAMLLVGLVLLARSQADQSAAEPPGPVPSVLAPVGHEGATPPERRGRDRPARGAAR